MGAATPTTQTPLPMTPRPLPARKRPEMPDSARTLPRQKKRTHRTPPPPLRALRAFAPFAVNPPPGATKRHKMSPNVPSPAPEKTNPISPSVCICAPSVANPSSARNEPTKRPAFLWLLPLFLSTGILAQSLPLIRSSSAEVLVPGAATDMTLTGDNLAGAQQVLILGEPGLTASLTAPTTAKEAKLKLTIAKDAPRGPRELRLVTPAGVTAPLVVLIDDLPPAQEKEPNDRPDQATPVTLPATIAGHIQAPLDVDHFRFHAIAGQRLIFDVQAYRTGSKLDSSLTLFDAAGRELAHDEDTNGLDSLIDYTAKSDGDYLLRIQDLRYQGGDGYAYRIRAGNFPYLDATFPLGARRGGQVPVQLIGRNLDPSSSTLVLNLPPDAPTGTRDISVATPRGTSNPRPFEVGDLPEMTEAEPNDSPAVANAVTAPVVINGRINHPGDVDSFRFRAAGPEPLVCEIEAQRYGSPIDALLTLTDVEGNVLQRNDDTASADARVEIKDAARDKEYVVSVTDLLGRGGDNFVYRLTIKPLGASADFEVAFQPDNPRVSRGGNTKLWCIVTRKGALAGDVNITLTGLPQGVTAAPVVDKGQPSSGIFALSAAPDAPLGMTPLSLVATAKAGDKTITHTFARRTGVKGDPQVYLTVLDTPPFLIGKVGNSLDREPPKKLEEIATLKKTLSTQTPALNAALAKWETEQAPKAQWEILETAATRTTAPGTTLTPEPDGSLLATGDNPPKNTYTILAKTPLKNITAIRLEAIADDGQGPGRSDNGNIVLSRIILQSAPLAPPKPPLAASPDPTAPSANAAEPPAPKPKRPAAKGAKGAKGGKKRAATPTAAQIQAAYDAVEKSLTSSPMQPVALTNARADFSQDGFPVTDALSNTEVNAQNGWAILPQLDRSHAAIFQTKSPLGYDPGTLLTVTLYQQSQFPQHTLRHFRLSVTSSPKPEEGPPPPPPPPAKPAPRAPPRAPPPRAPPAPP